MAIVHTNLTFSTETQSLWRPGPATDLTISSGDTMIWDPDPIVKDFGFSALGFSLDAQFYLDVRFGLLAYASLGTGGHFDADYTVSLNITMPSAVIAGNMMVFDYTQFDVISSGITTAGFGTPESSSIGKIGAGLDLIIEISTGFRNITFGHWFGEEGPYDFTLLNVDEQIALIEVNPLSPEFVLDLTDGVTLTARLPTGASIGESTSSNGGGVVSGAGVSERQFLSLDADLDALLVRMLEKISFPPVTAIAKFLGEVVFAEHSYDISDYLPFLGKDKVKFNFTLLDITANAGLNVTEEVSLDINRPGTEIPDITITLVSDNGTAGDTSDDIVTRGLLGQVLSLQSPNTTGIGNAIVTATYEINRGTFFHGVGVGINASITIDALSGYLSGTWVPEALAFSFGPLFSTTIPEGGLQINLGNVYEDTFEIDGSVFNTQTETYSVFFAEAALAPSNWNPDLPNAEETLYNYFRDAHSQLAAIQAQYSSSGFLLRPPLGDPPQSSYNFSGEAQKVMFIWTGLFTQAVTLNNTNGSVATVDLATSVPSAARLFSGLSTGATMAYNVNTATAFQAISESSANPVTTVDYLIDGKRLTTNASVNVEGTANADLIFLYGNDTAFVDGGANSPAQFDTIFANFAAYYGDIAIRWDMNRSVTEEQDSNPATLGGIRLFAGVPGMTELTVRNIERAILQTGAGDDYLVGWLRGDIFLTGDGNDIVVTLADLAQDVTVLEGGDDVYVTSFVGQTLGSIVPADIVYGGTGIDNVFVTPGDRGLRYDITVLSFDAPGPILRFAATNGIGADATYGQIEQFYSDLEAFGYATVAANPAGISSAVLPDGPAFSFVLRDGTSTNTIQFANDVEYITIADGGVGDDLVIFMGGTRYEGGAGTDTFGGDFRRLEAAFGTRGGLNIGVGRDGIDGFFGATVIEGFERLLVTGTTAKDVLYGGALSDHLDGYDGDDFLSGGNDSVADFIFGGDGNDVIFWANGGADTIRAGNGFDRLEVLANGLENNGLYYRFTSFSTGQILAGSEIYYWAYDPAALLLDALTFTKTTSVDYTMDLSLVGGVFASTYQIEIVNIEGSDLFDDLMIQQGGTRYVGGERAGDQDTFVADLRFINSPINFEIKDDEAADGSDGYLLANKIYVQGIDRAVLQTGAGDDRLMGGRLNDYFDAGEGNDTLYGAGGDNELIGGTGYDLFMWMAEGNDTISGGVFRDLLGRDVLLQAGGDGDSSLRMFNSAGVEQTVFGPLTATSSIDALNSGVLFALFSSRFVYNAGSQTLDYENISKVEFAGTDDHNEIALFQYGTSYWGGERDGDGDLFAGDFRFFGNPGIDFGDMIFDARTDQIYDAGEDLRIGGFERFVLTLGAGDHLVRGGDLGDGVFGNGGYITFLSGLGNDYFSAGSGGSLFEHTGGNDSIYGDAGTDVLSYTATGAVEVSFFDTNSALIGPVLSRVAGLQDMSVFQTALDASVLESVISHGGGSILFRGFDEFFATGSGLNDVLLGGFGQNLLNGGAGDDVLIARQGNTVMIGGAGSDTYVFDELFGSALILNETGAGFDTVLMFTGATFAELSFANDGRDLLITTSPAGFIDSTVRIVDYFATGPNGYDFEIRTTDSTFTIDLSFLNGFTGLAVPARSVVTGTGEDDDFARGNHVGREIHMGSGDDFAQAGAGADLFFGGSGQDGVSYVDATGAVTVDLSQQSGTGSDAEGDLYSSIEHVAGSLFSDLLIGSGSSNTLVSDLGNDTLLGLDGDDALFGGDGNDSIDGGNDDDVIQGDAGNDRLFGNFGSDAIFGGDGNDRIEGGDNDDLIETGNGNDTVFGGNGDDVLTYVGDGLDRLFGGIGTDWMNFAAHVRGVSINLLTGAPVLSTDAEGNEITIATYGNIENLRGTGFDDLLTGNDLDNIIDGGIGFDQMTGHAGNDTFISGAIYSLVDYSQETGGQGIDLVFQAFTPGISVHIAGTDTHGHTDRLFNIFAIIGTGFADNIQGNDNDNELFGDAGNDFLNGLNGNDFIFGGLGNDSLQGFFGSDTLVGGLGNNRLQGEDGNDVLVATDGVIFDSYFGGNGFDALSYQGFETGIEVVGGTQVFVGGVQIGYVEGVEHLIGGTGDDVIQLAGLDPFNPTTEFMSVYSYAGGFDTVTGTPIFSGGGGTISYAMFGSAVDVQFSTGLVRTTDSAVIGNGTYRDITSFSDILAIAGSAFDDRLEGAALVPLGDGFNVSQLYGGAGNDTLIGLGGRTDLDGGAGNDVIEVFLPIASGSDPIIDYVVDGGDGFDTLKINNLTGWDIDLNLSYSDLEIRNVEGLIGSTGDDTLTGNAGTNSFDGGDGNDQFDGGDGGDVMIYSAGIDRFVGGGGIDTLDMSGFGASTQVNLALAAGTARTNDTGTANAGPLRTLVNAAERDVENVIGTAFNDRIIGNDLRNILDGGLGNDTLIGAAGDDVLVYSGGLDTWLGDAGLDTGSFATWGFAINADLARTDVSVFHRGGANVLSGAVVNMAQLNTIENVVGTLFADLILGDAADNKLWGNGGTDRIDGRDGNDSIYGGDAADDIGGGSGNDSIIGGMTDADVGDAIDAGAGNDTVFGGAGNDTITAQGGRDNVYGDTGNDSIDGGAGHDTLYGGRGADVLAGGANNDVIGGGDDEDTLSGDDGNDTLDGGSGNDLLSGGLGVDALFGGDGTDTLSGGDGVDALDGGAGFDTASYADMTLAVLVTLGEGAAVGVTGGAAEGDLLTNIEGVTGSAANDTLTGNSVANRLTGGAGDDLLAALGGKDVLDGGQGNDTLNGGDDKDLLKGGDNDDRLFGGSDDDQLHGDAGADRLLGGDAQDEIYGGTGNDLASGDDGDDSLYGGDGNDTLRGGNGIDALHGDAGNDTLTGGADGDALYGGDGLDTADYSAATAAITANLLNAALNRGEAAGDIYDSIENVTGTTLSDVLTGNTQANGLAGGGGDDTLSGGSGNDTLGGGSGNDLLSGGAGSDSLLGGTGNDSMLGGSGSDVYVVDSTSDRVFETTTISGAVDAGGNDTVQSALTFSLNAYLGVRLVENLVLTGTADINGVGNTSDNTLTGNAGNNVLNGGLGADTMIGGAGDDIYIVDAVTDRVIETISLTSGTDAGGADTVQSSVSINLGAYNGAQFVETLALTGVDDINGTGNGQNNRLVGNGGNNALNGGLGNDTMIGGAGADQFVFNTALGPANADRITDFDVVDDTIRLDDAVFTGLITGRLAASAFAANLTGIAADATDRILYETDTGRVYFDADGTGAGARVLVVTLTANLVLTNADFVVF